MIKVTQQNSVQLRKISTKKTSDPEKFVVTEQSAPFEITSTSQPTSIDTSWALMQLQEMPLNSHHQKLTQRGQSLLQGLDQLQQGLLHGRVDPEMLQRLQQQLSQDRDLLDGSDLSSTIQQIEQRVAIELAKVEKGKKQLSESLESRNSRQ